MGSATRWIVSIACAVLRALEFLLALYVVGVAGWHVHKIVSAPNGNASPTGQLYAIISGVAALYTLLISVTTWLLPGVVHILHAVVDLLLCGGFVALAVLLRHAATAKCSHLSSGASAVGLWSHGSDTTYAGLPEKTCEIDKAAFAASVANAVFFVVSAGCSYLAFKRYRRNRAFGPGPSNGYRFTRNRAPKKARGSEETDAPTAASTAPAMSEPAATEFSGPSASSGYGAGYATDAGGQDTSTFTRVPAYARYASSPPMGGGLGGGHAPAELGSAGSEGDAYVAYGGGAGGFNPTLKEQGHQGAYGRY